MTAQTYDIQLTDHHDQPRSLNQVKDLLVVFFYPKAMTSGCTKQACLYAELYDSIVSLGAEVVGVSRDTSKKLMAFKEAYKLPFTLLSDPKATTCQDFGVWVEKSMYGKKYMGIERSTFILSSEGRVIASWRKVKPQDDAKQVVRFLQSR